ncbi:MATH domain and coiled-coil domain-containing protein At3g44800 [Humulus lupulus]|uniref:MATH domain and coiled-coil domain-containing protein At3g44800 n=1 Tax=Humulus lupulus TaxID=3486 RepID=UPI002B40E96F|nr:MATH domain and coiled-coil domain-containing protein At3g44800 [Humulus lupulus]
MASLTFNDPDDISRSISDVPPTHYTIKIQSFSLLTKSSIERHESRSFEAGGYKWNLVIHPSGNKNRNVKEHLSVYLAMSDENSHKTGWEVYAVFRLFVLDQSKDNYMIVQDGKERRFHGMKLEWGFDQFIPLKTLHDAGNGFLVDDTCVFGAEVFVCKERSKDKGECLRMVKDPIVYKHSFKVDNYFDLGTECIESKQFNVGGRKWKMRFFPDGRGAGLGTHISFYLALADPTPTTLPPGYKLYVEYILRIKNQVNSNHLSGTATNWFSVSNEEHGWSRYITLPYFHSPSMGFLVKGTCILEAEVTIHGVLDTL